MKFYLESPYYHLPTKFIFLWGRERFRVVSSYEVGLISLWLYKENSKLRD
jgi:hypothetical protein